MDEKEEAKEGRKETETEKCKKHTTPGTITAGTIKRNMVMKRKRLRNDNKKKGKKRKKKENEREKKHTTPGIRWSSPTQLLVWPSLAYLWESGRDPEFSSGYGRMCFWSVFPAVIRA